MKLSVSNIGWAAEADGSVYESMKRHTFSGLEIAPTRIFPSAPYEQPDAARAWAEALKREQGFCVPSMQSIWFGRQERIFGTEQERQRLVAYTKQAIDFAGAIGCKNLVFGCPRNRVFPEGADPRVGTEFFRAIGSYALSRGTVIGMEANPPIYNTNYINDTLSALRLIEEVDCGGFRLNLDVGTMIHNGETVDLLKDKVHLISHVHISEPGLKPIVRRELHTQLRDLLLSEGYSGFVSIEMGKTDDGTDLEKAITYIQEVFANA